MGLHFLCKEVVRTYTAYWVRYLTFDVFTFGGNHQSRKHHAKPSFSVWDMASCNISFLQYVTLL